MTEAVLSLKNVGKKFGKEEALKSVTLEVKKGDIYGLIGRNGAGKTTIMKLITGLSEQTSGEIVLLGKNKRTREYSSVLQRIGSVIEAPAAYNKLSAYENMKIICIQKGIHDLSVIEEALTFVNLADTKKKKFKNFSLGMKQRLGIAMALVSNPDFLILDEPINGLDPIAIIEFREIIERINREKNTTILISSHILTELYHVSTRFGFIHEGQMVQELTKAEFDASNTEAIVVKIDDVNKAAMLLKEKIGDTFEVVAQDEIHIFTEKQSVREINMLLAANGVLVDYIGKKENSLENYYTNLVSSLKEEV
ncbi:ABC transporter ATP-binding protein [Isobaculum melis]|uniref:ABC-2 type transport system ATP-binding protein n=1 Tax=Isobaculum melis TaxID=142588 RepID=A0A1H9U3J4_9LACT|nr:ABC transporter ATP-binding protein [Isobaculum melis]SES03727.1 ABC-2 type transport system ATP-binding protein [Isobaculum melis]